MRAWLEKHRRLVAQAEEIRSARSTLEGLQSRLAEHRRELGRCLESLAEPEAAEDEGLNALLGRSQAAVDAIESAAADRRRMEAEQRRLGKTADDARADAARAGEESNRWKEDWALAVEPLGLPLDAAPSAANEVVARIGDLFVGVRQIEDLTARIDGIDRDAEDFHHDVRRLIEQLAPDLAPENVERQVEEAYARLQKAKADDQKRSLLRAERTKRVEQRDEALGVIRDAEAQLDAMCQEAKCDGHDSLPAAVQRSEQARQLEAERQSLDGQLLRLAAGANLDRFVDEALAVDADALPGRLGRLDEEISQLEQERDQLRETRGREQLTLENLDTSAAATDAAERAESLKAQIESDARQYARLKLASVVLDRAIDRYRKRTEDPLLRRAGELFCELTGGSFESLRAEIEPDGENVLVGIRPDEDEPVHLSGMSDGTCDQLYLALRLAGLETYLEGKQPVPFIVDDVLIRFDDVRATAALRVLGDLSKKTQIIFFTHHLHLLALAEEHLDDDVLFVQRLPD
jgi:uncharacterized protein YhaN